MQTLAERYRPRKLAEVLGQDKAIKRIESLTTAGRLLGRAYWISGKSGTGKTTLARIIADKVADSAYVEEIDAHDLTPARIDAIEADGHYQPMIGAGRCYIVNEAHGLKSGSIRKMLTYLERMPANVVWIFTTTLEGQMHFEDMQIDSAPLLSRCVQIPLTSQGLCKPFAARLAEIATAEGLTGGLENGTLLKKCERLVQDNLNNFRAALQAVDAGELA